MVYFYNHRSWPSSYIRQICFHTSLRERSKRTYHQIPLADAGVGWGGGGGGGGRVGVDTEESQNHVTCQVWVSGNPPTPPHPTLPPFNKIQRIPRVRRLNDYFLELSKSAFAKIRLLYWIIFLLTDQARFISITSNGYIYN